MQTSWEALIIKRLYKYDEAKKICDYYNNKMPRHHWRPVNVGHYPHHSDLPGSELVCWQPQAIVPAPPPSWFEKLKKRVFTYLNRLFA
jgi:hypothetical protein